LKNNNRERYSRQIILKEIGEKGQELLLKKTIAIVGCGALGSYTAENFARCGVGTIKIIDRDIPELSNLQRQLLFDESDVYNMIPKAIAAANKLKKVNSGISIEPHSVDLNSYNITEILSNTDLILDGTDNFETRFLINDFSVQNNIPWIFTSAVGTNGMTMNIIPKKTPCLRCFIKELPAPGDTLTCETEGILGAAAYFISSIEVVEGIKILLERNDINKDLVVTNVWKGETDKINIVKDDNCSVCSHGNYEFLKKRKEQLITKVCGRDLIYITPPEPQSISFEKVAEKLKFTGKISYNDYFLNLTAPDYQIILFSDGRVSVKGIKNKTEARSLYSRLFGC